MPVVLRKRKAPLPPPAPAPPRKKTPRVDGADKAASKAKVGVKAKAKAVASKKKEEEEETEEEEKTVVPQPEKDASPPAAADADAADADAAAPAASAAGAASPAAAKKVAVGDVIDLDGFGGEIETNDGKKTSLKELVEESGSGVVVFTYPKASTPGCTTQVCLFRDAYTLLTAGGLAIYGLSTDSPKANTTFHTKKNLPYPLLCDPKSTLIAAIGMKKHPKGTQRGVFVVDKTGKVLVAEPGNPVATADRVKALVRELKR
ncbi:hypothetical protein E4U35_006248 [Claviceps purpurea]|uniref:thioredoxin-dependent peroxiredoxin n=1 Tax=Claviceps purpurea (strain 20.1) TaxID=1111077 RepID=M1W2R6_CLAP2|nr:hypothetical protein E4U36_001174 [Claviceps purpurea]KAG6209955.1 hypothetical protein E4U35_006248 [Claviceps purpurea]KAG6227248.1 hypothetical protein E4U34_006044 [Claviceps purpurea]CCE32081.1 related to DOT5-involved in derepression of telomeric silencing [Claviceps purpurea 20.1]